MHANAATYDAARNVVVNFWQKRLATGAQFEVPEPEVQNGQLAILAQQIANGWRYSVGNPYEELSFAEALDSVEETIYGGIAELWKAVPAAERGTAYGATSEVEIKTWTTGGRTYAYLKLLYPNAGYQGQKIVAHF